jgi:hypothetical protein
MLRRNGRAGYARTTKPFQRSAIVLNHPGTEGAAFLPMGWSSAAAERATRSLAVLALARVNRLRAIRQETAAYRPGG